MRTAKSPEDLTIDELRRLIVEKRRKIRKEHLDGFRKTGRVVTLPPELENLPVDHLHSGIRPDAEITFFESQAERKTKRILDRFLLAIEILAVIGLMVVIFNGIQILKDLNSQFALALKPAILTPTPLIVPVILPSGHTSPNSPGGAQPNEAEIPAQLLPLYQNLVQIPLPTPGPSHATQIQIPSINVDAPIVQGDDWEQLKKGVAQHIGSANPGQTGNMVLSAHNDVFGELFRHLDQLEPGDEIIVYTPESSYTYLVTNILIVKPTAVEVMEPTQDPTVTLISCYPYLIDNQRIVVQGSLQTGNK